MKVTFGPDDAFGIDAEPRTTAKRATPAKLQWNANDGTSFWQGELIDVIQTELRTDGLSGNWTANVLFFQLHAASSAEAHQIALSASQMLPAFLSLRLNVFVWIKEFLVDIGGVSCRLETLSHRYGITVATAEQNTSAVLMSVEDWLQQRSEGLRLVMAIYYYRHAKRLAALEPDRQSMAAEVILNLSKAIEIVFSANRDMLRKQARELGFESQFVERWIVPILLIRNELDVAHVTSTPLSSFQHQAILDFLDRASVHVHTMLEKLAELQRSGKLHLKPLADSLDRDKEALLKRIREYGTAP